MSQFAKPIITISKCLGFDSCRYNGITIHDHFVEQLKPFVEFLTICPEVEIGLGVPRDPIRLVSLKGDLRLMQPATGKDVTDKMIKFARDFLSSLPDVDGFILKFRSPSCGLKEVKIYPGMGKVGSVGKGPGFFGKAVLETFPHLPVEDEGRVRNLRIREHFLTSLFTLASFRQLKKAPAMKELVRFHAQNKLLLMAYNQTELKQLGKIVANHEKKPLPEVLDNYQQHLFKALTRPPKYTSNINVLMHALGHFSKGLSSKEKAFFLDNLEKYRAGKTTLAATTTLLNAWLARFDDDYLAQQTFFAPFPEELMELRDTGKGRNLYR